MPSEPNEGSLEYLQGYLGNIQKRFPSSWPLAQPTGQANTPETPTQNLGRLMAKRDFVEIPDMAHTVLNPMLSYLCNWCRNHSNGSWTSLPTSSHLKKLFILNQG